MRVYWYWPHPHRSVNPVAQAITRAGHEILVHSLAGYGGELIEGSVGYPIRRSLPDPVGRGLPPTRLARRLVLPARRSAQRREVLRTGFDVAHLETLTYEIDAFDLPRLARRHPIVARVHDVLPHARRMPVTVQDALWRRVYRSGVELVVDHPVLAEHLASEFSVPRDHIHVVPLPVPERRHVPHPEGSRFSLLFFGALRPNKGLGVLLEALSMVSSDDVELVIAGAGHPSQEALARDAAHTRPNVIAEIGQVSEQRKWELLARCDAVVMPYKAFASQSGVLLDAYAAGRPVLATDVGALGPTVRDDRTGEVAPAGDAAGMAEVLTAMIARPRGGYAAALAEAASARRPQVVADHLLASYSRAIERVKGGC